MARALPLKDRGLVEEAPALVMLETDAESTEDLLRAGQAARADTARRRRAGVQGLLPPPALPGSELRPALGIRSADRASNPCAKGDLGLRRRQWRRAKSLRHRSRSLKMTYAPFRPAYTCSGASSSTNVALREPHALFVKLTSSTGSLTRARRRLHSCTKVIDSCTPAFDWVWLARPRRSRSPRSSP